MDHPIKTRKWWAAAFIRALKTFAQTVVALVGVDAIGIAQVDWVGILSAAALALVLSFLTSIGGLPEVVDADAEANEYQGRHVARPIPEVEVLTIAESAPVTGAEIAQGSISANHIITDRK